MTTPFERGQRRLDLDEMQDDRLVRAEHRAGGDAEKEGVTDLAGGAGDGNANGGFHRDPTLSAIGADET